MKLTSHGYGKHRVRLSKITRHPDRHVFQELTVNVVLRGAFEDAYVEGDNASVLPTDTIKNTVYALAKEHDLTSPERFALDLAAHYMKTVPHATAAEIEIFDKPWVRMVFDDKPHHHAFSGGASERRTATVAHTRDGVTLTGGLTELPILKTTGSAFVGFMKDQYTALPEERDRIMATMLEARWSYGNASDGLDVDFNGNAVRLRETMMRVFADHESESVQHTMNAMAEATLAACPEIVELTMLMPNVHHFMYDLARFNIDNQNDIFAPTDEPHGYIEGTFTR